MAKTAGLGDNFYIGGYNVSGDVGSLGTISGGNAPIEMTDITLSGVARLGGLRNGTIEFTAFHDDAALAEYPALSTLLTTSRIATYFRGTTLGNSAASCVGKQINYDWTRGNDGSLTKAIQVQSDAYGLEWGQMITPGVSTITGAGNQPSINTGTGTTAFGFQAYLQVFAFTGTDVTIRFQQSSDDGAGDAFADISGGASFAAITSAPQAQRITGSTSTASMEQYLRLAASTSGGFTSLSYAVMIVKNPIAGTVF